MIAAGFASIVLWRVVWIRRTASWLLLPVFFAVLFAVGLSAGLALAWYPNALLGQFSTVVGYLIPMSTIGLLITLRSRILVNLLVITGGSVAYLAPNPHLLDMPTTVPLTALVYVAGGASVVIGQIIYRLLRENFAQGQQLERGKRRVERINERMVDELEARSTRVTELVQALDESVDAERTHIARELHDELGQLFGALRIELAVAEERVDHPIKVRATLARLDDLCGLAAAALHDVVRGLRPRAVDELGLVGAIKTTVEAFASRAGLRCRLSLPEAPLDLETHVAQQLYRILQEALTNVLKHADAASVYVDLSRDEAGQVQMWLRDDGVGFDVDDSKSKGRHGLLGIEERAQSIGADLAVDSRPGEGTEIRVVIRPGSR